MTDWQSYKDVPTDHLVKTAITRFKEFIDIQCAMNVDDNIRLNHLKKDFEFLPFTTIPQLLKYIESHPEIKDGIFGISYDNYDYDVPEFRYLTVCYEDLETDEEFKDRKIAYQRDRYNLEQRRKKKLETSQDKMSKKEQRERQQLAILKAKYDH